MAGRSKLTHIVCRSVQDIPHRWRLWPGCRERFVPDRCGLAGYLACFAGHEGRIEPGKEKRFAAGGGLLAAWIMKVFGGRKKFSVQNRLHFA